MKKTSTNVSIVLFDGMCNLCSSSVQFIIQHDKNDHFQFASLQSDFGKNMMAKFFAEDDIPDSVLLIEQGKMYSKSTAAIHIALGFGGAWRLFAIFFLLPPFIRNLIYDYVARNRYKWFGEKQECWVPTPELRAKFLE